MKRRSIFARKTSGHRTSVETVPRLLSPFFFSLSTSPVNHVSLACRCQITVDGGARAERNHLVRTGRHPVSGKRLNGRCICNDVGLLTVSGKFDLKGGQTNRVRYDTFSVVEQEGGNFPRGCTRVTNKRGKLS